MEERLLTHTALATFGVGAKAIAFRRITAADKTPCPSRPVQLLPIAVARNPLLLLRSQRSRHQPNPTSSPLANTIRGARTFRSHTASMPVASGLRRPPTALCRRRCYREAFRSISRRSSLHCCALGSHSNAHCPRSASHRGDRQPITSVQKTTPARPPNSFLAERSGIAAACGWGGGAESVSGRGGPKLACSSA